MPESVEYGMTPVPTGVWSESEWRRLERLTNVRALQTSSEDAAWEIIIRQARAVLRAYSTSFFIVTRFLPLHKRSQVEAVYAAVRYPDEIVDSFPLAPAERMRRLDVWAAQYEEALTADSIKDSLSRGTPCFLASFSRVVREAAIPPEHYRSFIAAMRLDVCPRRFLTLDDLIDSYIYGSAIVVGYFLTYIYGAPNESDFARALVSARYLGVALQLTNFLRDVGEDQRRGRLYLPLDLLRDEGVREADAADPRQQAALNRVLRRMAAVAEDYYARSLADLDAFSADSQTAIRACIDVYRRLNERISRSPRGLLHRESVPLSEKFRALPPSKYWRLPLAYLAR
ncbi:MAG TPA: phytoene/squalene synthase family protein [Blastocatellia bacterium]|nr:phytoene/squalene synthase family protein [Blastocatellia bacterium]